MVSVIVAVAANGVIGGDNRLLWHISEDLKHFKEVTFGSPVIMGRKTYESLGRPLPGRDNVVITRSDLQLEGCRVVHSLEEALELYSDDVEAFVIGGAQIYGEAMRVADRFYLTRVERDYEGDTHYPSWDESQWDLVSRERFERGAKYEWPFVFEEYRRSMVDGASCCITPAKVADIALLRELAIPSFTDTYKDILPEGQNEYMLDLMYSCESLERQFADGYRYFILYAEGRAEGYVSLQRRVYVDGRAMVYLDKIYLLPRAQGCGLGRVLFEFAFAQSRRMCGGGCCMELSVNRFNQRAMGFYEKMGLAITSSIYLKLGDSDFYRDDHFMSIEL
ncbi:MAG: dihydrofolate reductase [Rikenellaceae bacterium]